MTYSSAEEMRRDFNPTPEAKLAMIVYGDEYSRQGRGSMGFWDLLPDSRQRHIKKLLAEIADAAIKHGKSLNQMIDQ